MWKKTLKILGIGFSEEYWKKLTRDFSPGYPEEDITPQYQLIAMDMLKLPSVVEDSILSHSPDVLFISSKFFENDEELFTFLKRSARLTRDRLGQVILVEDNIELTIESIIQIAEEVPQLFFPSIGEIVLLHKKYIHFSDEKIPELKPIYPFPKLERKNPEIQGRTYLTEHVKNVYWKGNEYQPDTFIDIVCETSRLERKRVVGFFKEEKDVALFCGFPIEEIAEIRIGNFAINHLLEFKQVHTKSKNYHALIKKIQFFFDDLLERKKINQIVISKRNIIANTPVKVSGEPFIASRVLHSIMLKNGYYRSQYIDPTKPVHVPPIHMSLLIDEESETTDAYGFLEQVRNIQNIPGMKNLMEHFIFREVALEELVPEKEIKQQLSILQARIEKFRRDRKTLQSRKLFVSYDSIHGDEVKREILLLENLLRKKVFFESLPDPEKQPKEAVLLMGYEEDIGTEMSRQISPSVKQMWLNLSEFKEPHHLLTPEMEYYKKFEDEGQVIIQKSDSERLKSHLEELKTNFQLNYEDPVQKQLEKEIVQLEQKLEDTLQEQYEALYYYLWIMFFAIFREKQKAFLRTSSKIVQRIQIKEFSKDAIQCLGVFTNRLEVAEILFRQRKNLFPNCASEDWLQILDSPQLETQLTGIEELEIQERISNRQKWPTAIAEKLARKNALKIKQHLDSVNLKFQSKNLQLIILEQDFEWLFLFINKLKSPGSRHQFTPTIAVISGENPIDKLKYLILKGVKLIHQGKYEKVNPMNLVGKIRDFFYQIQIESSS